MGKNKSKGWLLLVTYKLILNKNKIMKAEELRIGNSIIINGDVVNNIGWGVIKDVSDKNIGFKDCYLDILKHEPIPLTEEWLESFGFINQDDKMYELSYDQFDFECYYSYSGGTWNSRLNEVDLVIKYVHQLQNLYFTLTGEELKIKLK